MQKDILLNWAHQHVEYVTSIWTNDRLRIHTAATWFSFQISNIALRPTSEKKNRKPNGTPFKQSCKSWKMTHCAAGHMMPEQHTGTRRQPNTHTATLIHTHARPHICMTICRTFETNTLNEATVGRTPSSVLRNPIKVQKDIKSFSPFNKVDLFVVWLNSWILDSTVISCFQSRISKTEHSIHNDKFPFCYLPFPCKLRETESRVEPFPFYV